MTGWKNREKTASKPRFASGCLPNPVKNLRGQVGFVLRQKTPVVPGNDLWGVLDRVARLLERARLFKDVRGEYISHVVRSVGEETRSTAMSSARGMTR